MNRCKLVDIYPLKASYYRSTVTTMSHQMKFQCLKILRKDMKRPILNTSTSHGEWISFFVGLSLLTAMQPGADSERRLPICWCKCTSALNESLYRPTHCCIEMLLIFTRKPSLQLGFSQSHIFAQKDPTFAGWHCNIHQISISLVIWGSDTHIQTTTHSWVVVYINLHFPWLLR